MAVVMEMERRKKAEGQAAIDSYKETGRDSER